MIGLLRKLLGVDRFEDMIPEDRDRHDALRNAERAKKLAERLQDARRQELALRLEVRGRR